MMEVFKDVVRNGVRTKDYFGYADGFNGDRYLGLVFGEPPRNIVMDDSSVLVQPEVAAQQIATETGIQRSSAGQVGDVIVQPPPAIGSDSGISWCNFCGVDRSPAEVEIRPPLHQPNTLIHQYPDGLLDRGCGGRVGGISQAVWGKKERGVADTIPI